MAIDDTSLINRADPSIVKSLTIFNGEVVCSDVIKRDKDQMKLLENFLATARTNGYPNYRFVTAAEFEDKYSSSNAALVKVEMSVMQKFIAKTFLEAYKRKATDIHVAQNGSSGTIKFRIQSDVTEWQQSLPWEYVQNFMSVLYGSVGTAANSPTLAPDKRQDARITNPLYLAEGKIDSARVHYEPIVCSEAKDGKGGFMAIRLLYDSTEAKGDLRTRFASLGYRERDIEKFERLSRQSGLVVFSGPTGHGKSTALKHYIESMVQANSKRNYISYEDPPEYVLKGVYQIKINTGDSENPNLRTQEYTNAIGGALRVDPDVILIGEVRFPEASRTALDMAMTGHAVLCTVHAFNAPGVIQRFESLLNAAEYAHPLDYLCNRNVLAGIVYQRLVPKLCPYCKMPLRPTAHNMAEYTGADLRHFNEVAPDATIDSLRGLPGEMEDVYVKGPGCDKCDHRGTQGMSVVAEVIETDDKFLAYMKANKVTEAERYWFNEKHEKSYVQAAVDGVFEGRFDPYLTETRIGAPLNSKRVLDISPEQKM